MNGFGEGGRGQVGVGWGGGEMVGEGGWGRGEERKLNMVRNAKKWKKSKSYERKCFKMNEETTHSKQSVAPCRNDVIADVLFTAER